MHGRRNRLWRLPLGKPQRCSIIRAECQPDNLEQPAGPAKERSQGMALLTCKGEQVRFPPPSSPVVATVLGGVGGIQGACSFLTFILKC